MTAVSFEDDSAAQVPALQLEIVRSCPNEDAFRHELTSIGGYDTLGSDQNLVTNTTNGTRLLANSSGQLSYSGTSQCC